MSHIYVYLCSNKSIPFELYMSLIMYTGKKVTFKQLFALLRKDKVGEISE